MATFDIVDDFARYLVSQGWPYLATSLVTEGQMYGGLHSNSSYVPDPYVVKRVIQLWKDSKTGYGGYMTDSYYEDFEDILGVSIPRV